jgi:putative aldouronate transport system substrate-binding protein
MKNAKMFLISALVLVTLLAGCGGGNPQETIGAGDLSNAPILTELPMPIANEPIEMTVFSYIHPNMAKYITDWSENEAVKEFMRRTGVTLKFTHPPSGQDKEQFNIMIATGDLPDIIIGYFHDYKGGAEAAMTNGLLMNIDELVEHYAPNYKKNFLADPEVNKLVRSDNGTIIKFGQGLMSSASSTTTYIGPMLRGDYLARTGLGVPETIDEWYAVLNAFKAQGVETPLVWGRKGWDPYEIGNGFVSAYGVTLRGFCRDDANKVMFSPIEPKYKEFLTTMNKWYKEGLLDRDFSVHSPGDHVEPMLMNGKAGAAVVHLETSGKFQKAVVEAGNPSASLIPAPQVKLTRDQQIKLVYRLNRFYGDSWYITKNCKYPKEAVMLADALYLTENGALFNLGIEGKSYMLDENQKVYYTDEMKANSEKITATYKNGFLMGLGSPYENRDGNSNYPYEAQSTAFKLWRQESDANKMPEIIRTEQESKDYTNIMNDIHTYTDDMMIKFIMGLEPLDQWDAYVAQVKSMRIDDAIKIQQDALNRFLER